MFKLIFFELGVWDFSKIFRDRRRDDPLSNREFLGKSMSQKKVTELFSKNVWGGPNPQGVPKFYEGVGVVDRGHRDLSNGVKIVTLRLLYL